MRITDVRTVLYEYPLHRPVGDVQWAGAVRNAELAVFLGTDEGAVGVGIAGPGARSAVHGLGQALVGRDPRAVAAHWERLQRLAFKAGPHGILGNAIAALDCALWDLRAKSAGVPLWRELGADTGRVPAYASGLDAALVLRALGQVDEIYQAAVALFYLEDRAYKEISEILDIPLGTVKSRIARGICQLQKLLASDISAGKDTESPTS